MATLQTFMVPTLISESRVLDIRNLDVRPALPQPCRPRSDSHLPQIMKAKVLENELPVFVVAWRTQEVLAYRDIATGEITQGSEDKIEQVGYVAVMTRIEEEVENPITGGWKIIDVSSAVSACTGGMLMSRASADGEEGGLKSQSVIKRPTEASCM